MRRAIFIAAWLCLMLPAITVRAQQTAPLYDEPYRPQFHFTPEKNWMNDPNGLVYYKGEYHLFYQYNPFGDTWGHMSWGHAVSRDLVRWKHLPVALAEENGVMIFSGSAVVDRHNTSGLCRNPDPKDQSCLVAIYTGHTETNQSQNIATSNDRGRTWTKYKGNPVLDIGYKDFRDPKVFWHEPTKKWVMVVALAQEKKVQFYGSTNLREWQRLGEFGPAGLSGNDVVWECPDLFELPIVGQPGKRRWVLIVNVNPGGFTGGSGGQYFIGKFDGKTFTNDNPADAVRVVDYGKDFYAAVTFSDIPKADGRRILLGWMSNWQYAQKEPTGPWRTAQSIPRVLALTQSSDGLRLTQQPLAELKKLRGQPTVKRNLPLDGKASGGLIAGEALEIESTFAVGRDSIAMIRLRAGAGETVIGYDAAKQVMFVDRTKSGNVGFDANFAGRHEAPLLSRQGRVTLRVLVDRSSVEVFGNGGQVPITDRIYPPSRVQSVELAGSGATTRCLLFTAWKLRTLKDDPPEKE
jgi:sucrose-6-phosphate hydrolase SacC (GH32 family)